MRIKVKKDKESIVTSAEAFKCDEAYTLCINTNTGYFTWLPIKYPTFTEIVISHNEKLLGHVALIPGSEEDEKILDRIIYSKKDGVQLSLMFPLHRIITDGLEWLD